MANPAQDILRNAIYTVIREPVAAINHNGPRGFCVRVELGYIAVEVFSGYSMTKHECTMIAAEALLGAVTSRSWRGGFSEEINLSMLSEFHQCFEEGKKARKNGISITDNPFPRHIQEWSWWRAGYEN